MILGIETSCDDSAMALLDPKSNSFVLETAAGQVLAHEKFGGVVPEIASRQHLNALPLLYNQVKKKIAETDAKISIVAVATKPGLIGSLLVGSNFGRGIALTLNVPFLGIDHLEGHLFSPFISTSKIVYPHLNMLVSGGHSHLYLVNSNDSISLLGKTTDDACGEAFDKVAVMMGLKYPGGQSIEKLAELYDGDQKNYFTMPLAHSKTLSLSYSGLKTAVRYKLAEFGLFNKNALLDFDEFVSEHDQERLNILAGIAENFQRIAIGQLLKILEQAIVNTSIKNVAICGGVASNSYWRKKFLLLKEKYNLNVFMPLKEHSTDNAAMIAFRAKLKIENAKQAGLEIRNEIFDLNTSSSSELQKI